MRRASIVIGSANPHKIREIEQILSGTNVRAVSAKEAGIALDVEEDGDTFEANAAKKAVVYAKRAGVFAMADDSGLEVRALDGRPGVFSARYAGPECDYAANNRKLLAELAGLTGAERAARFVCVIAFASPEGLAFTVRGEVEGEITEALRGASGFGYDPLFLYPPAGNTFAELPAQEKNAVSHRGRALAAFRDRLIHYMNES